MGIENTFNFTQDYPCNICEGDSKTKLKVPYNLTKDKMQLFYLLENHLSMHIATRNVSYLSEHQNIKHALINNKNTIKEAIKINQKGVDVKCITLEIKCECVPPELECPGGTFIMNFVNMCPGTQYENLDNFIDNSIIDFNHQIETFRQKD